jgi:hypothetical protein
MGAACVNTDVRDCLAMVELLVRGQGWPLRRGDGEVAEQAARVAHRRRKMAAAVDCVDKPLRTRLTIAPRSCRGGGSSVSTAVNVVPSHAMGPPCISIVPT